MMKFMRVQFILALIMVFMIAGCAKEEKSVKTNTSTSASTTVSTEAETVEIPEEMCANPHPVAGGFASGDGTKENPYQISNADQLALLAQLVNYHSWDSGEYEDIENANFILTEDIYFNDISDFETWNIKAPEYYWEPIGMPGGKGSMFSGFFDGNGHTVYGLYIYDGKQISGECGYGMFCWLHDWSSDDCKATIQNLNIDKSYFHVLGSYQYVGGIASNSTDAVIKNCTSNIIIEGEMPYGYVGGIVAHARTTDIIECINNSNISVPASLSMPVGGISGEMVGGTISNCENNGYIEVKSDNGEIGSAAGIVYRVLSTTKFISDPNSKGWTMEGVYETVDTVISNCTNNVDITGSGIAGVLLASDGPIIIENCKNNGNVQGMSGIVGRINCSHGTVGNSGDNDGGVIVRNCINVGNVENEDGLCAGIAGKIDLASKVKISDCENKGEVSGLSSVGGIVGDVQAGFMDLAPEVELLIENCKNRGTVTADEGFAGGMAGSMDFYSTGAARKMYIKSSENFGTIASAGYGIGGILGGVLGMHGEADDEIALLGNVNSGLVQGDMPFSAVGGIVGYYPAGEHEQRIENCVNKGEVHIVDSNDSEVDMNDDLKYYALAGEIAGAVQKNVLVKNCSGNGKIVVPEKCKKYIKQSEQVAHIMENNDVLFLN